LLQSHVGCWINCKDTSSWIVWDKWQGYKHIQQQVLWKFIPAAIIHFLTRSWFTSVHSGIFLPWLMMEDVHQAHLQFSLNLIKCKSSSIVKHTDWYIWLETYTVLCLLFASDAERCMVMIHQRANTGNHHPLLEFHLNNSKKEAWKPFLNTISEWFFFPRIQTTIKFNCAQVMLLDRCICNLLIHNLTIQLLIFLNALFANILNLDTWVYHLLYWYN
jgi:hypothetical protein